MTANGGRPGAATAQDRLSVQGGELSYETAGAGPAVLFIHSAIADRRMWDRQFIEFSREHRTIRFDLRGYGGSPPATESFSPIEDIRALLTRLGHSRTYLVGSSMGGALAIDFALNYPEMVRGLLLVAPGLSGGFEPPFDPKEQEAFDYDDAKSREVASAWADGDSARAFELLRQLWCPALAGPNLELFRRMVGDNAAEVFGDRSAQLATSSPPAAGRLGEIRVPTTVLVGDRDNPSSPWIARRIVAAIPASSLALVPGADHLVNLSRPNAFDQALRGALGNRSE